MSFCEIPPEQTREMQAVGLRMALFFDEFCTRHGLMYFLCGGCCIGAARDGRFIPWDDDVDVFMPREDYEKLKALWEDTEQYEIQFSTETFRCQSPFVTICDRTTTFIKTYRREMDVSHGVALDVLPLDGCPAGWRRKAQKLWALAYSLFVVGKAPENHGRAVWALGKLALALMPGYGARYRVWRYCEARMSRWPIRECEYVTELCSGPHYMQNEYPRKIFERQERLPFEGHELPVPVGYDEYLTMAFGDWRTLPPEEKRICHHEYEWMDMQHSYTAYKGIYYCVKGENA